MVPVLEAVPNFSEGRDLDVVRELVRVVESEGAEVLDWSADPDHNRSVITFVGPPSTVEDASVAAARVALEAIDLRRHRGVHPRVGALDVLPFVPLLGLGMHAAVESASRVAGRLADEVGIPAYLYARASDPPGRPLHELRRGGFEALRDGFPSDRRPDRIPPRWSHPGAHPTAGVTCVGARPLLLAWNVFVEGVGVDVAKGIAAEIRQTGGGFAGLRALGLELPEQDALQISMNLEDLDRTSPFQVFVTIEDRIRGEGGRITGTEVIGLVPDTLVLPAAGDRLKLPGPEFSRLLSARLARHVSERASREAGELLERIREAGDRVPREIRDAAERLADSLTTEDSEATALSQ
ncbi:MAG: glutamate formimidoyltransferase [Longimicrobiales bacterium]